MHRILPSRTLKRRSVLFACALAAWVLPACSGGGGGSSSPPGSSPAELVVTPAGQFSANGPEGGPFAPSFLSYTVANTGGVTLDWRADSTETWATLSATAGTLDPGQQASVIASIDQVRAATLPSGIHTGSIDFVNETNGVGSTFRGLVLTVSSVPGMRVTPGTGFTASGPQGGPFTPGSTGYTIENDGTTPVDWRATSTTTGLTIAPTSGTLASGQQQLVTLTIDQTEAAKLRLGTYSETVTFHDDTSGRGTTDRPVTIEVRTGGPGQGMADELTQFGITWTFDREMPVGQFANGDWWVVGPVTITDIDPPSDLVAGRISNGSMVNPSPARGMTQGYDSTMYAQYKVPGNFNNALNVAYRVTSLAPLVVSPHSSLVSTISESVPDVRPQIESAAILTVLDAPAPDGSFRPPYCGAVKAIEFNESQLDYTKLARLAPAAGKPEIEVLADQFRRPWIDHVPLWIGRYLHPSQAMPDYGREMADRIGTASLLLNLDAPDAVKRDLLVGFVQLGIDFWGIVEDGGRSNWPPSAGHMSGRKWPILFAGIVLGDPDMASVGFDETILFGEDGQCFYVEETAPGVYNQGFGGYGPQHVGMAEWGTAHQLRPELDDVDWYGDPYRICCTANAWWGQLLAAYAMGAKGLWNHDALFDYQDRYLTENLARGITDWRLSWTSFPIEMWKAYRADY